MVVELQILVNLCGNDIWTYIQFLLLELLVHFQCHRLNPLLIPEHKISFIHFQTTLFNFDIDTREL